MARGREFWNRMADRWAARQIGDMDAFQTRLRKTQAHFTPQTEVLDLGCGTGTVAIAHAPLVRSILATDYSDKMIAIARDRARAAGVANITWATDSIEDLDVGATRFDVVIANLILHLVDDRHAVIARAFELLRPGGVLVSNTHCLGGLRLVRLVLPLARAAGLLPPMTAITTDRLIGDLQAAGFTIEDRWQPGRKSPLFVVARKPGVGAAVAAGVSSPPA